MLILSILRFLVGYCVSLLLTVNFTLLSIRSLQNDSKKEVMRSPPPVHGAMVVSSNQQGNWGGSFAGGPSPLNQGMGMGGYGSQTYVGYGAGTGYGGQQQQFQQPQQQFSGQQYQQPPQQYGQPQQQYGQPQQMQYPQNVQQQQYNQFQQRY